MILGLDDAGAFSKVLTLHEMKRIGAKDNSQCLDPIVLPFFVSIIIHFLVPRLWDYLPNRQAYIVCLVNLLSPIQLQRL